MKISQTKRQIFARSKSCAKSPPKKGARAFMLPGNWKAAKIVQGEYASGDGFEKGKKGQLVESVK